MPATAKDLEKHDQPAIAVDLVLMTIEDGQIRVLVQKRKDAAKVGGDWALPGTIVRIDETLEQCVHRVLADKAGLGDAFVEQLQTFGALERDPRGRVIAIAYYALTPAEHFERALRKQADLRAFTVQYLGCDAEGPVACLRDGKEKALSMAFDHARILGTTIHRLRGKLDYTPVGLELLPARFTLRDLQEIHETILGTTFAKPAFRRKMLDKGFIRATGKRERGKAFRPAELYERKTPKVA